MSGFMRKHYTQLSDEDLHGSIVDMQSIIAANEDELRGKRRSLAIALSEQLDRDARRAAAKLRDEGDS